VTPDAIAAIGAFLSGMGAMASGWWVIRSQRQRDDQRCKERIEEARRAFYEGLKIGKGEDASRE